MKTFLTEESVPRPPLSSLGVARFVSTLDPSIVCGRWVWMSSTTEASVKVTNPNPLDRFVSLNFITTQSLISPKRSKYSFMPSSVVE